MDFDYDDEEGITYTGCQQQQTYQEQEERKFDPQEHFQMQKNEEIHDQVPELYAQVKSQNDGQRLQSSFDCANSNEAQLKEELNRRLNECGLNGYFEIKSEIENTKQQISLSEKQGNQLKLNKLKQYFENLNSLQKIAQQLNLFNSDYLQNQKEQNKSQLLSNSQIHFINRFNLGEIKQILTEIPLSSEKLLMELLKESLKCLQSENDQGNQQALDYVKEIEARLNLEDQFSKENAENLQRIKQNLTQHNYNLSILETESLLKKIRPLNIYELRKLIKEAEKASKLVKDKEIILLLGQTGTGKSTTIHYLSGSVMKKLKTQVGYDKFLNYIGPDENLVKNEDLKRVKIGFRAESETRYITPIYINYRDIGIEKEGQFILCDSAGFLDTAGAEVDISNGIGIVEAVKMCKSVRPVILVSFNSFGEKGEGIKQLAQILVGLVDNISDKLRSFSYLFTKYPQDTDVNPYLHQIRNSLRAEEISDVNFSSLFDDMIDKTEMSALKIDPLDQKPARIIKELLRQEPIKNPKGIFQFSITEKSKSVLSEQVRINQMCIISASKRHEYQLIQQKLDDLAYLIDILNQDSVKQIYTECINFLKQDINKSYENAVEQLKKCIKNQNKLDIDDLVDYQKLVVRFQGIENLRKQHLGNDVVQTSSLIQALKESVETMSEAFSKEQNMNSPQAYIYLDNIKLISEQFPEIENQYKNLLNSISQQIQLTVTQSQNALESNDFIQFALILSSIKQYANLYTNHFDEQHIMKNFDSIVEQFDQYLLIQQQRGEKILQQTKKSEKDVNELNSILTVFESVEQTTELKQHVKKILENVNKTKQALIDKAHLNFQQFNKQVEHFIREDLDNQISQLDEIVQEMSLMRKIKWLENITADSYHSTISEIVSLMSQKKREIEQSFSEFKNNNKKIDFDRILSCINWLKQVSWMNDVKSGTYDNMIKVISEELVKYCNQNILEKLIDLDINLNRPENVQIGSDLASEIEKMRSFDSFNCELAKVRETAFQKFFASPKQIFENIKNQFREVKSDSNQANQSQVQQVVCRLDGRYIERLLVFIDHCRKSRWLRGEAENAYEILKSYLDYCIKIKSEEMNICFSRIKNASTNEMKEIPALATKLSSHLKEINDLESNSQTSQTSQISQTFELINGDQLLASWKDTLKSYYIQLNDEMGYPSISTQALALKICISRAMIGVDFIVGNDLFQNNYLNFQKQITKEFRDIHLRILELIEKNDYSRVQVEIANIDENPINEKALNQIKYQINQQINYSFEELKFLTISSLGDNMDKSTVKSIVDNQNKINSAKKYLGGLQGVLDQETFAQIDKQMPEIKLTICTKVSQFLESIQALMRRGDFFEAEQKREHITQIQLILGPFWQDQELNDRIQTLKQDLEQSVEQTVEDYKSEKTDFTLCPPKPIMEQLHQLSTKSLSYAQSLSNLQKNLINKARNEIKKYQDSSPDEKSHQMIVVETFLSFLPEDMKLMLQNEFNSQKNVFKQKEEGYQNDLNKLADSQNLESRKKFLEKCNREQMSYYKDQMVKQIQTDANRLKQQFKEEIQNANINQAIQKYSEVYQYKNSFAKDVPQVETVNKEIHENIKVSILKILKYLKSIATIDEYDSFEKEYGKLIMFIDSINEFFKDNQDVLGKEVYLNIDETYSQIQKYLVDNQMNYEKNLEQMQINQLEKSLSQVKKWDKLVKKIIFDLENFQTLDQSQEWLKSMSLIAKTCKSYDSCITKVQNTLENIKQDVLSLEFKKEFQEQRNKHFSKLEQQLKILKAVQSIKGNFLDTKFDLETYSKECLPHVINKIDQGTEAIKNVLSKEDEYKRSDFDTFNLQYENISSIKQNVKIQEIQNKLQGDVIDQELKKKIKVITSKIDVQNINTVTENLLQMKLFAENIPSFKNEIDQTLDETLKTYLNKDKAARGQKISELATILQAEETGLGATIIADHACFKGQQLSIFNQSTKKHGIDYVLKNIEGDEIDKDRVRELHDSIKKEYEEITEKYLVMLKKKFKTDQDIIQEIALLTKQIASGTKHKKGKITWDFGVRSKIPTIIAHIFALWSLMNIEFYNEMGEKENSKDYLFQPHSGQIVSIFRLLGLGYVKNAEQLQNNLIQIGTGQGKSVTLAVTSCIFSLIGVDVYCACYSEYLSNRDYESFVALFDVLGITKKIKYGPFNKICELIINENGDLRKLTTDFIENGFSVEGVKPAEVSQSPKVLLIDEVDVFFSNDFYGSLYNPLARLKDLSIQNLAKFIWKNRTQLLQLSQIQETEEYKECVSKFKNLNCIIDESIKDMVADSKNFKHEYEVMNDKIAYKEQDSISFDITYGYKTLFAYFYEQEKGRISQESLDENTFIGIRCGSYSYAEIPLQFQFIVGVTGTLKTLSEPERDIIRYQYNITKFTYIPSVFGQNKRKFAEKDDLYVESTDDFYKILVEQIEKNLHRNGQKRAILVFFESKQKLMDFYNSPVVLHLKQDIQIITEECSSSIKEKNLLIKRATTAGQISFLTSSFGRGTDFVSRDQQVQNNGGVHVIQAFYSTKKSEEVQIMGRTARQEADGSCSIIIEDSSLEVILGTAYREKIKEMRSKNNFYEKLDEARTELQKIEFDNNKQFIDLIRKEHERGQQFILSILSQNEDYIKQFLKEQNKGESEIPLQSRILVLVDATSSMGVLLNKAKNTVSQMFDRACQIIIDNSIPNDSFKLQFAVYRDYDCMRSGILQSSPWESKPENLRVFLDKIIPKGGADYEEAVEIGLQHANHEHSIQPISQVILIADAPAKNMQQIKEYRVQFGGESYWQKTKFSQITDYKTEIQKLKDANIPIHCFYLNNGAKENFEEIATFTNGKSQFLDINQPEGSEILTHIVVEPILQSVGQQNGKGDNLVEEYKKLFAKSYK